MAQDPSGAWVAMPRPLPPPRRRRPPDAGKARKPGSSASFLNLVGDRDSIYGKGYRLMFSNSSSGRCGEILVCLPHSPADLAGSRPKCVLSLCSARRYLSPERLASVRREDPRSRTTSSSSNCSAKKEG